MTASPMVPSTITQLKRELQLDGARRQRREARTALHEAGIRFEREMAAQIARADQEATEARRLRERVRELEARQAVMDDSESKVTAALAVLQGETP